MNINTYNQDIKNPKISKIDLLGYEFFINHTEKIIITLSYKHVEFYRGKRVFLDVFPIEQLNIGACINPVVIDSSKSILFNCYSYSNKYSFKSELKIDKKNKFVELNMMDLPELGLSIFSKEELDGIKISY